MNELLQRIHAPEDLKQLSPEQLTRLAAELRSEILHVVAANGGHLAANLGVAELTIAILYAFHMPEDRIVFDVGHQSYAYKLLTGRQKEFKTLRQYQGMCGFPVRGESEYDAFGAGHAGVAISAALGMCAAEPESPHKVIAFVGDGAFSSGVALEGLNNVDGIGKNLVIILNDNKMAIAPNVGAIRKHLNRIIVGRRYKKFKLFTKRILNHLPHSKIITHHVRKIEEAAKAFLLPGGLFEELGLRYIGPIDGHNISDLIHTFEGVRNDEHPVVVHVLTEKGRGYAPAVSAPELYHGVGCFDPDSGAQNKPSGNSFSATFGDTLTRLAATDSSIHAVVAAMGSGVGLDGFFHQFPERFHDVGIAEAHAVAFAAGLAATGKIKPVVAIYATFLQRSLDHIFHEVALMNLPVVFAVDRAGVVEDGPTHHGIYDLGFLRALPNLTILAPCDEAELSAMLRWALNHNGPSVIRYPKGKSAIDLPQDRPRTTLSIGQSELLRPGTDAAIYATGAELARALRLARRLEQQNHVSLQVVNPRFIAPLDRDAILRDAQKMPIITLEDHTEVGGFGEAVAAVLTQAAIPHCRQLLLAWPAHANIPHGAPPKLRIQFGLDDEQIASRIVDFLKLGKS